MKNHPGSPHGHFHEAPLAAFTAAAIAGGGVAASRPLAWILGLPPSAPGRKAAMAVLFLVGGGLLLSVQHLGRRSRMTLAMRRAGRNALSTEVLFASLTVVAALALAVLPLQETWTELTWGFASLAASGLLMSLAWVYWIPAQLTWKGVPALAPMPLALLFGITAHTAAALPRSKTAVRCIIVLVVIDAIFWIVRCIKVERGRRIGTAAQAEIMAARGWIMGARFALLTLLFPIAIIFGVWFAGLALLGLGILVDRFAFYGLAIQQTSESEIARVETIIKSSVQL
jgi:DMSO reductase anchor subunit